MKPKKIPAITPLTRKAPSIIASLTSPIPMPFGYIRCIISMNRKAPAQKASGIHHLTGSAAILKTSPARVRGKTTALGIIMNSQSINDMTISELVKTMLFAVFKDNDDTR
ncbi:MAG: hypothetical protein BWY60_00576 [Actinobacteria bacterium ADurb.Bin346]|nr:MAG: hypothetical protein BWY60_00576 [Actinobacteria bacterium ADurb.Bin346]